MSISVTFQGTTRDPSNNAVGSVPITVQRDDGAGWVAAGSGTSAPGTGDFGVNATGSTDPDQFRIRAEAAGGYGPSDWTVVTLNDLDTHVEDLVLGAGRDERRTPESSWVSKVSWVPSRGLQVQFKRGRGGAPYFECFWPGTVYADYLRLAEGPSFGKKVHAWLFRRAYVPVAIGS